MIPSMIDPGTPTDFGPLHAPTADYEQPSQGHDRTVRVILEVIFISTAVFALIMGLLLRLMCLRRDHRPLTDFLNPLPPPPGHMRHDREASPHPSHGTTHSEQMRQTIFLPTLPLTAPQHPPAAYIVPVPIVGGGTRYPARGMLYPALCKHTLSFFLLCGAEPGRFRAHIPTLGARVQQSAESPPRRSSCFPDTCLRAKPIGA